MKRTNIRVRSSMSIFEFPLPKEFYISVTKIIDSFLQVRISEKPLKATVFAH